MTLVRHYRCICTLVNNASIALVNISSSLRLHYNASTALSMALVYTRTSAVTNAALVHTSAMLAVLDTVGKRVQANLRLGSMLGLALNTADFI